MTVTEETETESVAVLNDMIQARKEIHLKQGSDITDIFGYQGTKLNKADGEETEQVTLGVTEDRRKNISQFDLAYIDISGEVVLAAFDSCSTSTLIHRELIDEGKIEVTKTSSNSNINGIGGVAKGKVVEVKLYSRNEEKSIVINATVVDEIMHLPVKDGDRFDQLTMASAEALRNKEGFTKVTKNNFQQVPGGKI